MIILQVQDYRLLQDKAQSNYKDHELKAVTWNKRHEVCRITRSVPNYTCIFLDFVCGFSSYVKGLLKTKQCNAVSVLFPRICEMALSLYDSHPS